MSKLSVRAARVSVQQENSHYSTAAYFKHLMRMPLAWYLRDIQKETFKWLWSELGKGFSKTGTTVLCPPRDVDQTRIKALLNNADNHSELRWLLWYLWQRHKEERIDGHGRIVSLFTDKEVGDPFRALFLGEVYSGRQRDLKSIRDDLKRLNEILSDVKVLARRTGTQISLVPSDIVGLKNRLRISTRLAKVGAKGRVCNPENYMFMRMMDILRAYSGLGDDSENYVMQEIVAPAFPGRRKKITEGIAEARSNIMAFAKHRYPYV